MKPLVLAALLASFAIPAHAEELPARKAGLWESTSTGQDGTTSARQCVGEGTDAAAMAAMGGNNACSRNVVTKTPEGWATETNCKLGPVTAEGRAVITGDFETKVRTETTTTLSGIPGVESPTPRRTVITAKYLGPCEAGQKPGDIVMPDGKVVRTPGSN